MMQKPKVIKFKKAGDGNDVIEALKHDGETLRVQFRGGGCYDYEDVSDELVTGLVQSKNRANFILERIRPDRLAVPVADNTPFPRLSWD
jgi:hypothetical protein